MLCRQSIFSAWSCPFLFFFIDITRLYKPVLKISINWSLWGWPGKKPIIKCHGDEQTSLEKDLQMRCHYKISKKEKLVVTQNITKKHLNLFGINLFNFKQIVTFLLSSSFVIYFSLKTRLWRREKKWTAMVRRRKKKTEAQRVKKKEAALRRKNWNMLYTTSESTHTNTSPAKGKEYKSRINNKLAVTHWGPVCQHTGRGLCKTIEKFLSNKIIFNSKRRYALN